MADREPSHSWPLDEAALDVDLNGERTTWRLSGLPPQQFEPGARPNLTCADQNRRRRDRHRAVLMFNGTVE